MERWTVCTEWLERNAEKFAWNNWNCKQNAEWFARNGLNGERNAERIARNDSNGERLEWFECFGLDFKICISETLTIY
jgi:hypothetical protein